MNGSSEDECGTSKAVTISSGRPAGWDVARKQVMGAVRASQAFRTLRDMSPDGYVVDGTRLQLQWPLGEGSFAHVNLAIIDGTRKVAVKQLRKELLSQDKELQLFFAENQLLRRLRHPCIVEFIGVGGNESAGDSGQLERVFIVQEYCEGGSMRELVLAQMYQQQRKLYSQQDALRWGIQVARALQYLHSRKPTVIHRDLKLENVLRTHKIAAQADAKLCDFGLAVLLGKKRSSGVLQEELGSLMSVPPEQWDEERQQASARVSKMLRAISSGTSSQQLSALSRKASISSELGDLTAEAGSYGYMAPEVLKGEAYTESVDIFSFAMVLYNLFYRVIPSVVISQCGGSEDMAMYAWKVAGGYRPDLSPTMAPPEVNDVIEACWKGTPSLRPNAAQVVRMLEEVEEKGECRVFN